MVSLEVAIEMLSVAIENLSRVLEQQQHPQLIALSQTVEGQGFILCPYCERSGVKEEWSWHQDDCPTRSAVTLLPEADEGETPAAEAPPEPEEPNIKAVVGEDSHVLELIDLAKELGYEYLYHEGNLAVDNRVLDEYNRRNLETNLEP